MEKFLLVFFKGPVLARFCSYSISMTSLYACKVAKRPYIISYSYKSNSELNAKLNNDLHCLEEWLHGNKLTITVTKIQAMIVGSRPNLRKIIGNPSEAPYFAIGASSIDITQSAR